MDPEAESMLNPKPNAVLNCNEPVKFDKPTVAADPICNELAVKVPFGKTSGPVKVPPVRGKSPLECPFNVAVIIPALKFPLASLDTMVLGLFKLVAVVALFATKPAVDKIINLLFAMVPTVISASTINEVDNNPADEL